MLSRQCLDRRIATAWELADAHGGLERRRNGREPRSSGRSASPTPAGNSTGFILHNFRRRPLVAFNAAIDRRYPKRAGVTVRNKDDFGEEFKESEVIEVCASAGIVYDNMKKILNETPRVHSRYCGAAAGRRKRRPPTAGMRPGSRRVPLRPPVLAQVGRTHL